MTPPGLIEVLLFGESNRNAPPVAGGESAANTAARSNDICDWLPLELGVSVFAMLALVGVIANDSCCCCCSTNWLSVMFDSSVKTHRAAIDCDLHPLSEQQLNC